MRIVAISALALLCAGRVTTERVRFQPKGQQGALARDGQSALVLRKKNSIVMIRPAGREFSSGWRPLFVVGMTNLTRAPLEFRVPTSKPLKV